MLTPLINRIITERAKAEFARAMRFDAGPPPDLPSCREEASRLLYLHVPFCQRLCPYCSFNRFVFQEGVCRRYFKALRKEIGLYRDRGYDFQGIYVGGGTPTILPDELAETLHLAREAGLSLCSGGIIGMGESLADRIDLALELRDLEVDSIPLNILTPIPGTPLADLQPLGIEEVLTTIALFRFINPGVVLRIAGGRQQLGADQYRCFTAGANGAMVGNYLTTSGSAIGADLRNFTALGYSFA